MKIRYITPFALDKNIGRSYNEAISELPTDSYICLRDGDTLFLTPDWGERIEAIIKDNPQYDLITCMTNRVGIQTHCVPGMFDVSDIGTHIAKANERKGTECIDTKMAPGLCMIFHRSVWEKTPFVENSIFFDKIFSNQIIRKGGKIGLATGLYIFHLYRWGQKIPQFYTEHLK